MSWTKWLEEEAKKGSGTTFELDRGYVEFMCVTTKQIQKGFWRQIIVNYILCVLCVVFSYGKEARSS